MRPTLEQRDGAEYASRARSPADLYGRKAGQGARPHGQYGDEVMRASQWVITAAAAVAGVAAVALALTLSFGVQFWL